jgi:hypothetical protein
LLWAEADPPKPLLFSGVRDEEKETYNAVLFDVRWNKKERFKVI